MDFLLNNTITNINTITNANDQELTQNQDVLTFLNNAVLKTKSLNHNKLQIELQKCICEVNQYKSDNETFKNKIEELSKEKNVYIEFNEKHKLDLHKMTQCNEELIELLEHHKKLLVHEKNINQNLKTVHDAHLLKLNKLNDELCIKSDDNIKNNKELSIKNEELQNRYKDLTILYSKQTNDFEMCKKELKHLTNELNTSNLNNKILHDELELIKTQTVNHLNKIEELKISNDIIESKRQVAPIIQVNNHIISMTKPPTKITNRRGLKVTNR